MNEDKGVDMGGCGMASTGLQTRSTIHEHTAQGGCACIGFIDALQVDRSDPLLAASCLCDDLSFRDFCSAEH